MSKTFLILFNTCVILSAIFFIIHFNKQKREGIVKYMRFKHIEGIDKLAKGIDVLISFNKYVCTIDGILIKIPNIKKLEITSSKQLVDKEKSVIGRAIVGGVLTGGIGAVVGGMSGINDGSKETRLMHYLTMTFNDGNKAIFSFKNDSDIKDLNCVIKVINK